MALPVPPPSIHSSPLQLPPSSSPASGAEGAQRIATKILSKTSADITLSLVGITALKVIFFPIWGLLYLLGKVAVAEGLGGDEAKKIDSTKREELCRLGGKEITFKHGERGPTLEGMYFNASKGQEPRKTILLCTGSHNSYEQYAPKIVEALLEMGHHVMVFNYEGFGKSEGERSEEGVYRSVEAAYQYLRQEKQCDDNSIVAWGYSLGSGAVTELASRHTVDMVIDRGFTSLSDVAYKDAPNGLKTIAKLMFVAGARFDNLNKIKHFKGKAFIAQGRWDKRMGTSPYEQNLDSKKDLPPGQQLQDNAQKANRDVTYAIVESGHDHDSADIWFKNSDLIQGFLSPSRSESSLI